MDISDSETLIERFGEWPSFHDSEIYAVRLDSGQGSNGSPSIELDIHAFAVAGSPDSEVFDYTNHSLVTLRFERVEDVALNGFGPQNVLDDLVIESTPTVAGPQHRITLPSNNGLEGAFRCESIAVLKVVPFVPGDHSVYGG